MHQQTVSQLNESELISAFMPILTKHNERTKHLSRSRLLVGPGDDCSVLDLANTQTVMTIDTLTEGHDFRVQWKNGEITSGFDLGWKAATQNLADVAAMGATPVTLLVSLSLPPSTPVNWVLDFARGLVASCQFQGADCCTVSGGDLGGSEAITVTITAVGATDHRPVLRSGAQAGDAVAVAGVLGYAACGLQLLESEESLITGRFEHLIQAQKRPRGAMLAGIRAAESAHAMLDVSDGLVRDARRLCQASSVSIDFDRQAIDQLSRPLLDAATAVTADVENASAEETARTWVLTGGEDHAMLATFAQQEIPKGFTTIGYCTASEPFEVRVSGESPNQSGWDHFRA